MEIDLTFDEEPLTTNESATRPLSILKNVTMKNKNNPLVNKSSLKEYVMDSGALLLKESRNSNVIKVVDLLCRGAPFISDNTGVSPLHFAAYNNSVEITELLLNGGMLRDVKNKVDRTPLHIAAQMNHIDILRILLSYGADPNIKDIMNMTPLHWASENGNAGCIELLLKYGAQTDTVDNFGRTPADIAKYKSIVDILQNKLSIQGVDRPYIKKVKEKILHVQEEKEDLEVSDDDCEEVQSNEDLNFEKLREKKPSATNNNPPLNNVKDTIEMLKEHGIQMLEPDNNMPVHSAVESGRKVVLTEAGKLLMNSTLKKEPIKIRKSGSILVVQNGTKFVKLKTNKCQLKSLELESDKNFLKALSPSSSSRIFKGKYYSENEDGILIAQLQSTINKLRNEAKMLDLFAKRKFRQANLYQEQLLALTQLKNNQKKNDYFNV